MIFISTGTDRRTFSRPVPARSQAIQQFETVAHCGDGLDLNDAPTVAYPAVHSPRSVVLASSQRTRRRRGSRSSSRQRRSDPAVALLSGPSLATLLLGAGSACVSTSSRVCGRVLGVAGADGVWAQNGGLASRVGGSVLGGALSCLLIGSPGSAAPQLPAPTHSQSPLLPLVSFGPDRFIRFPQLHSGTRLWQSGKFSQPQKRSPGFLPLFATLGSICPPHLEHDGVHAASLMRAGAPAPLAEPAAAPPLCFPPPASAAPSSGRGHTRCQHSGNREQPQNCSPMRSPLVDVRSTIGSPHFPHGRPAPLLPDMRWSMAA